MNLAKYKILTPLVAVVFIRLMGFGESIYRVNLDQILFYTEIYPPEPTYQCELTLASKEKIAVKDSCDEIDLYIANGTLKGNKQ